MSQQWLNSALSNYALADEHLFIPVDNKISLC